MAELTQLPGSKIPMQMFQERISLWLTLGRSSLESGSLSPVRRSRPNRFQPRPTRWLLREQRTDLSLLMRLGPGQFRKSGTLRLIRITRRPVPPRLLSSTADEKFGPEDETRDQERLRQRTRGGARLHGCRAWVAA